MTETILSMRGISKTFPGVKALSERRHRGVPRREFTRSAARTVPGKSTLMKVLSGVYPHGDYEG